ncbi:DEAD/DEAH box helicase [Lamprocystis purpurea]|jgi:ATP-dependent RNA helicase RhlB|uniref:DEAD/DEAH box helicase n=1 Tax=Lamprocystis purpurea TaxID=61598 RepID=UPI00035DC69C|nr:DEAD/DEAH box helicase [Lamprocystis purpurea]
MTETHLTTKRFDSFDLDLSILQGLADAGFSYCTPIQAATLPIALAGQDVAGQAQTGTGKTAAFLLVILERLLASQPTPSAEQSQPRALIVAPTRELAVQIHNDTLLLARHTGFRVGLVFGGTGYQQQRDDLAAGVDILIGTPGRLIDYYKQHVYSLNRVEVVVLDEADRMFDLGFIKDIRFLFRHMPHPEERLGMLFSATLSYRVLELAYEHMNQPQLVKIESEHVTADRVRQVCYMTANSEKIPLLIGLVLGWEDPRVMVFVNTKREADRVWGFLQGNGINTAVLSGDVPQKKRLKLLKQFTDGELPVLVGTDVAARGLHIPDVTHVVNYDLPEDAEDYVHRIGRTARAGAAGDAVSFVCETYAFCLPDIERFVSAKIPVAPVDAALLPEIDPRSRLRPEREDREYRSDGRDGRGPRDGGRSGPRSGPRDGRSAGGDRRRDGPGGTERPRRPPQAAESTPVQVQTQAPAAEQPVVGPIFIADQVLAAMPDLSADLGPDSVPDLNPDQLPVRTQRRRRRMPEQAALTSPPPPGTAATAIPLIPAVSAESIPVPSETPAAPVEAGGEPVKKRRRRRRRKPAGAPGETQPIDQALRESLNETSES